MVKMHLYLFLCKNTTKINLILLLNISRKVFYNLNFISYNQTT